MRINKNIKTIAIEGMAGSGKTVLIRYLTRNLLGNFSKEDFVIIGKRLDDYRHFKDLGELIILDSENDLNSVLESILDYEKKRIIILSEMSEKDIREEFLLISKNKKHLILIEAQELPNELYFDMELIGRNAPLKAKARNLDLNLERGQFWVNDVILFDCPYISEDYQIL